MALKFWKIVNGEKVVTEHFEDGTTSTLEVEHSIKANILPDKGVAEKLQSPPDGHQHPWVSKPFIDKISLVMEPPSDLNAHDSYNAIMASQGDPDCFVNAGRKPSGATSSGRSESYSTAWQTRRSIPFFSLRTTRDRRERSRNTGSSSCQLISAPTA